MRTGPVSASSVGSVAAPLTGGADQTTATTTPAGLMTATRKTKANRTRTGRPSSLLTIGLLVRKVFELRGKLAPLALRQGLTVAGDGDQQRRCGTRDRIGQDLLRLCARDDLAPGPDDVCDPISPDADDVAPTAYSG